MLLAFLLPVLALANNWTLPTNPTTGASYSLRWQGRVSLTNTVVMMSVLPPGSGTWAFCGSGYPDSNLQATVTGGRSFSVNGTWRIRITQQSGSNLIVCAETPLLVGPQPPNAPPSVPTNLSASNITGSGFSLSWTPSTDDRGIARYDIYDFGQKIATASGASAVISGLTPGTSHSITVEAFDILGLPSGQSAVLVVLPSVLGWTPPANPSVGSYGSVRWVGNSTSSTVLMWYQPPGSSTWMNCGGGGSGTNPRTVTGGCTFNASGTWLFQVRDGTTPVSPVLSQTAVNVR